MIHRFFRYSHNFLESHAGHWFIGSIIMVNALILGAQTFDHVPKKVGTILHKIDEIVLIFFILEISLKIAYQKRDFFKHGWNIFDFLVIVGSLVYHQDYLPILRALRSLHLMSAMDAVPKMRHIIAGIWKALPGILNVFGIVLLFFYISCVMGVFLFKDTGMDEFRHIGLSMQTMFQVMTGDDWSRIMHEVAKTHPYAWAYFIFFYIAIVFIFLNLFIGVVVSALQAAEAEMFNNQDEDMITLRQQLRRVEGKLDHVMQHLEHSPPPPSTPPQP